MNLEEKKILLTGMDAVCNIVKRNYNEFITIKNEKCIIVENLIIELFKCPDIEKENIIDVIIWDDYFQKCIGKKEKEYRKYYGSVDVSRIVYELTKKVILAFSNKKGISLENDVLFMYGKKIKSPKGLLIDYCFKKKMYRKKIIQDGIDSYLNRYKDMFPELQEKLVGDPFVNELIAEDENIFDNGEREEEKEEKAESTNDEDSEFEENDILEENLADTFSGYEDVKIISKFSVDKAEIKFKNTVWDTQQVEEEFKKQLGKKVKKWQTYKKETIKQDIDGRCLIKNRAKKLTFDNIFTDIKPENNYIKKMIIEHLSKRQALIIGLKYYEMKNPENIVNILHFKDINALNDELSRSRKILKFALLNDYQYIQEHFPATILDYWVRRIRKKFEKKLLKNAKIC
jgi:hypothetical protein